MRPLMLYVLLPMSALAATAIPTDPARAATKACVLAAPAAPKTAANPALVETKKEVRKLEAL